MTLIERIKKIFKPKPKPIPIVNFKSSLMDNSLGTRSRY